MEQGLFLQKLSDALEESKNKVVFHYLLDPQSFLIIIFGYMEEKHLMSILGYLENY